VCHVRARCRRDPLTSLRGPGYDNARSRQHRHRGARQQRADPSRRRSVVAILSWWSRASLSRVCTTRTCRPAARGEDGWGRARSYAWVCASPGHRPGVFFTSPGEHRHAPQTQNALSSLAAGAMVVSIVMLPPRAAAVRAVTSGVGRPEMWSPQTFSRGNSSPPSRGRARGQGFKVASKDVRSYRADLFPRSRMAHRPLRRYQGTRLTFLKGTMPTADHAVNSGADRRSSRPTTSLAVVAVAPLDGQTVRLTKKHGDQYPPQTNLRTAGVAPGQLTSAASGLVTSPFARYDRAGRF